MSNPTRNILHTRRLILREIGDADLDFIADLLADTHVMRHWPSPYTREHSAEWIARQRQRYAEDGCGYWLAVAQDSNRPIGQVGVMMTSIDGVREPALGWIIAADHWRRGFAYEAAAACVGFTFETLAHHRAVALIREQNLPSIALAGKLGLRAVGTTLHAGLEHLIFAKPRPGDARDIESPAASGGPGRPNQVRGMCMNGQFQIGVLGIVLTGMMLSGCATRPRGEGVPVPMDQVRGSWRLVGMNGRDVPATPPITLTIEPENRVAGSAGVNRYFGVYQSPAAGSLRFFQMGSTRMAGEPEAMRRETEFFTTLERVRSFTLDADVLEMSDAQSPVLIWRRDARPQRR